MPNTFGKSDFDSTHLLQYLWRRRWPLLIVSLAAAMVSAIVSLLIEPKYKSVVVFFPSTHKSISKALAGEVVGVRDDIMAFGQEEEVEHALQILQADMVRDRIIGKYDLMKHYDIDLHKDRFPWTKLHKTYEGNIHFSRTEFLAVKIEVLDKSPDTAAFIANDIADLLDSALNGMRYETGRKALEIVEKEYNDMAVHLRQIKDSLATLGSLGIYDYKSQSEVLNREYAQAIARNDLRTKNELEKKLDILARYGSAQMALAYQLEFTTQEIYPVVKRKYDKAKTDATETLPHKFVVSRAYPAERKSYPVRWLIVVISTLSAFLMCLVTMIAMEKFIAIFRDNQTG